MVHAVQLHRRHQHVLVAHLPTPRIHDQPVGVKLARRPKFARPEMRSALMLYLCETDREFVLSRGHAFSPVPDEFAKWADEVAVEKDVIADAFEAAHEIDPHSTEEVPAREILMQGCAKNTELKINDQMLGGFMKRKFIDTKDISVRKKKTKHAMVWTGLKRRTDCSTYDWL